MNAILSFSQIFFVFTFFAAIVKTDDAVDLPKFVDSIANVTVFVGGEAVLNCAVENLGSYKVAWIQSDTQTILTIVDHIIVRNDRLAVTHSDRRWSLHIKDARESDQGRYMCQINTDPMKSQVRYLEVVVPPEFGSPIANVTVPVGEEVIMNCTVENLGDYEVVWRRADTLTILTVGNLVVVRDDRIAITHSDRRNWFLHIKDSRESDRGRYSCQINTDPLKSQDGYLEILDSLKQVEGESNSTTVGK